MRLHTQLTLDYSLRHRAECMLGVRVYSNSPNYLHVCVQENALSSEPAHYNTQIQLLSVS